MAQRGDNIYDLMILEFLPTEAVGNIVKFLGMHPCERSDKVPDNKNTHMLLLAGKQHFWVGRAWVAAAWIPLQPGLRAPTRNEGF